MADIFDEEEAEITFGEEGIMDEFEEETVEDESDVIRHLQDESEEEEDEMPGRKSETQPEELEDEVEEEGFGNGLLGEIIGGEFQPSYDFAGIVRTYKKVSDAKEKFIPKDRREYQTKLEQIDEKNRQVNMYKERLCRLCRKDPITKCDEIEISRLKCCIKQALSNLNEIVKDLCSKRVPKHCEAWKEIKLATSFDEDITPVQLTYNFLKAACKSRAVKERPSLFTPFSEKVKSAFSSGKMRSKKQSEDNQKTDLLKGILQKLGQKRSEWDYSDSESKHMVQYTVSVESKLHNRNYGRTNKISKKITTNEVLIGGNNREIKTLKNSRLKNWPKLSDDELPTTASGRIICNDCWCGEISTLEKKVKSIEQTLKNTKGELCKMWDDVSKRKKSSMVASDEDEELKRLKKYYIQMDKEFKEKNHKLLDIKKNWGSCLKIFEQNNFSDDAVVRVFRRQYKNLCEEISKLKTTLKHQSEKIENYRIKFMNAKKKMNEQKSLLDKVQTKNSKIEDQINLELKQIKTKYQKKMQEFSNLPELVKNEQRKICEANALRNYLENDLRFMCKEYKSLKSQIIPVDDGPLVDWKAKFEEQRQILNRIRLEYDAMLEDKLELCKKLESLTTHLNCLLFETGKIIKNCQEEAENDTYSYGECSTRLERQIVECRMEASSCEAIQKEKICKVQLQICNLQTSFEGAQRHIKCLKDRLKYLASCEDQPNFSIAMCSPAKC